MQFTVLISAYSINPYRALDDGLAWNIVRALDQKFRLIVVTHPANRLDIERFLSALPGSSGLQARFEYYSPPRWGVNRDRRPPVTLLHKYSWHWGVVDFIRERGLSFDIAHHLSFPCGWCPSFLWRLNKPFIWGPAGYPPAIPADFLRPYGRKAYWKDRLCLWLKKAVWRLDPFVDITSRQAAHVFALNQQVVYQLKLASDRTTVLSSLTTHAGQKASRSCPTFKILSIGAFAPRSGLDLVIRAFALFQRQLDPPDQDKATLVLVGRGAALSQLRNIAAATGLSPSRLQIIESEDPAVLERHLSESKVFFAPAHETANRLLPQALAHGLPVVCFDHRESNPLISHCCGLTTPYDGYEETIRRFAGHLHTLFRNEGLRQSLAAGARRKFERQLTWAARGDVFAEVYWNVFHRSALSALADHGVLDT